MAIRLIRGSAAGRWIVPDFGGLGSTSQTFTVGRVLLTQFALREARLVDAVDYIVGATAAGNVTAGIIGPVGATSDSAAAGAVAVQSSSTAQGTANTPQLVTFTATLLGPGMYYAALEGDNATGTYMRLTNQLQVPLGLSQTYDRSGGYGALTDPTPAVTDTGNAIPALRVRLA